MTKTRSIREFLALSLNQDYKFPLLEVFFFLFILLTCITVNTSTIGTTEYDAYSLVNTSAGLSNFISLFVFVILVSKNIALSLSGDLEKGTMKTYFSYPIKRREILSSKLFSEIAITSLVFFAANFISLCIIAPNTILPNISTVLIAYASIFAFVLLISSLVTLIGLTAKKGSLTLILGVILFIALFILSGISTSVAYQHQSLTPIEVVSYINPLLGLLYHYQPLYMNFNSALILSFDQAITSIVGCYVISTVLFALSYYYFNRRMSL